MKILALDTTAKAATCAICEDKKVLSTFTINTGLTHSETMLPMIEQMMKDANTNIDDIDLFACSTGPGSFTGVRIGVSIIKGLAFGRNKACIGISSLEALSRNVTPEKNTLICPVMDARRNQLYNAIFKYVDGKYIRLTPDRMSDANDLINELIKKNKKVIFVGDGCEIMAKLGYEKSVEIAENQKIINGYGVAMVALDIYEESSNEDIANSTDLKLMPTYLRPSQAERNKNESN